MKSTNRTDDVSYHLYADNTKFKTHQDYGMFKVTSLTIDNEEGYSGVCEVSNIRSPMILKALSEGRCYIGLVRKATNFRRPPRGGQVFKQWYVDVNSKYQLQLGENNFVIHKPEIYKACRKAAIHNEETPYMDVKLVIFFMNHSVPNKFTTIINGNYRFYY